MGLFRRKEEPTKVDGLTMPELRRLVLEQRGYRPSDDELRLVLDEGIRFLPHGIDGMASPGVRDVTMASPGGMDSPEVASVDHPTTISDSMTREEFLVRFDATILMSGGDSGAG